MRGQLIILLFISTLTCLLGCSSLHGLPVEIKAYCEVREYDGLRYEPIDDVPPIIEEVLMAFTTNVIDGFDFSSVDRTYVVKDQFDWYRAYWFMKEGTSACPGYVATDISPEGYWRGWSGRFGNPRPDTPEEEFIDDEGNHVFDLGPHSLKISDGAERRGFSKFGDASFSTEVSHIQLIDNALFINWLSFGTLGESQSIFVDHGDVYIDGHLEIGSIPDDKEWRLLHPKSWMTDSVYMDDRLVVFRWNDSYSTGKSLFGKHWMELGGIRIEIKGDQLAVIAPENSIYADLKIQLTESDVVLLNRDEVFLLNEGLRRKSEISGKELDSALSKGGHIQRIWPSSSNVLMKKRVW